MVYMLYGVAELKLPLILFTSQLPCRSLYNSRQYAICITMMLLNCFTNATYLEFVSNTSTVGDSRIRSPSCFAELKEIESFEVDLHVTDVHKEPVAPIRQASDSHA